MVQYDIIQAREGIINNLVLDPALSATAGKPSMSFGNGDTGWFESSDNVLEITTAGTSRFTISGDQLRGITAGSSLILNELASSTNPTLCPNRADVDTGIGWAADDALSLIAGAIEGQRLTEASSGILIAYGGFTGGITAFSGGGQGSAVQLISSYNIITTVAANQDSVKLPASFVAGTIVHIINADTAQTVDVFPGSGDDLGAGANNAINIGIGESISFFATVPNTTWAKIAGST